MVSVQKRGKTTSYAIPITHLVVTGTGAVDYGKHFLLLRLPGLTTLALSV